MAVQHKLVEAAVNYLDRETSIRQILEQVRRAPVNDFHAGRYHFLWDALQNGSQAAELRAELSTVLASDSSMHRETDFDSRWLKFVGSNAQQTLFLHGIALMHWEWAQEFEADDQLTLYHHQRAKHYWCIYWRGRVTAKPSSTPTNLMNREPLSNSVNGSSIRF